MNTGQTPSLCAARCKNVLFVIFQVGRKLRDHNAAVKNLSINEKTRDPTISLNSKFTFCLCCFVHTVEHTAPNVKFV